MAPSKQQDFLSPQQMQTFVAGLAGLDPDEIRKAKVLYVMNAISEYKAMRASLKAFGKAQLLFAIIPIFWPILLMQRSATNAGQKLYEERISNALLVWKDDLGADLLMLQQKLAEASGAAPADPSAANGATSSPTATTVI